MPQAPVTDSETLSTLQSDDEDLGDLLLEVLPSDGTTIGNLSARELAKKLIKDPTQQAL